MKTESLLLAYYGDDFTGSTDVMESLSRAGLKTVLFLRPPTSEQLARFPELRAFGIAGGSRAMSPRQMERALPPAFKALKASGARFIHYKTCSTFDSSPAIGSIGKAIELGQRAFAGNITPLVVGVPVLGRYVVFGNLFARSGLDTEPSRLDRHPTMSRHPVTPMDEADIRLHLAKQIRQPIELIDVLKLQQAHSDGTRDDRSSTAGYAELRRSLRRSAARGSRSIVLFDTLNEADLLVIGRLISDRVPTRGQLFCVGSSGVEYALVAHWQERGLLGAKRKTRADNGELAGTMKPHQVIAVSGSCSPVTERQISCAVKSGFVEVACNSGLLAHEGSCAAAVEQALAVARDELVRGRSVIFHTARGAEDKRRAAFERAARKNRGSSSAEKLAKAGASLGHGLARILDLSLACTGANRGVVCGGDTSMHVARELGIEALEFTSAFTPGGPLCRVHAPGSAADGCDLIFKGGQVGRDRFFPDLANGGAL
jgi:uncharacterized protein YgbK (DUF1537 family)